MSYTLLYIIKTLAPIVTFFFVARFLLQATRADFYNPISQGVVAITDPIVKPIRMLIPSMGRWDFASLVAACLLEGVFIYAKIALSDNYFYGVLPLTINAIFSALDMVFTVIWALILISIVASLLASFGNLDLRHPILSLINQIVEPIMAPARAIIPPMGGLDLSPILVILVLGVISDAILPQLQVAILSAL